MHLHQFLAQNRDELLRSVLARARNTGIEVSQEQASDLSAVLNEVVAALERAAGRQAQSSLPDHSLSATQLGRHAQRDGTSIRQTVKLLGAISVEMGNQGALRGLSFDAGEYGYFNGCIDECIAGALEHYWTEAQNSSQLEAAERLGAIAHELRNTLWTARMSFVRLQEGQVGLQSRTGQVLERSLSRMQQLVSQALVAAQLEARVAPEHRTLSIANLLAQIEGASIPERDIRVCIDAPSDLQVVSDESLLTSALGNLLQNALKFTKSGGEVTLSARQRERHVCIEVRDQCGGLSEHVVETLFSPFSQREQRTRGVGLGLSITKKAVEAVHGTIGVRNLPGEGCAFTVCLPTANPLATD